MTAAETIRRAATEMRAKAEAANTDEARRPYGDPVIPPVPEAEWGVLVDDYLGGGLGAHCSSWTPLVAHAVAAWLDAEANVLDRIRQRGITGHTEGTVHAVAVARAYLREAS